VAAGLTLQRALELVDAARAKAEEMGFAINVAVVDEGENLLAFARMDGALLGSIDVAIGKARTARAFEVNTSALAGMVQPGQDLYGLQFARPGVVAFGGGAPLAQDGRVVGGLGVSGGPVPDDTRLAEEVAAQF
jgi:uncharacterized protein GlcG (DUF336 family)